MKMEEAFQLTTLGNAEPGSFCMMPFHGDPLLGIKAIIKGPVLQTRFAVLTHPRDKIQPRLARPSPDEQAIQFNDAWIEPSLDTSDVIFRLKHAPGYICKARGTTSLLVQVETDDICFVDLETGEYNIYPPEGQRICFTRWRVMRRRDGREPEMIYSFG